MAKVSKLIVMEETTDVKWFLEYLKENSISFMGWARKILLKEIVDFNTKNNIGGKVE